MKSCISRCIVLFMLVGSAQAATLYTYTGNNFTTVNDSSPPAGAYTTSMQLTLSFVVADELTESPFTDISGSILEYSFFDGRHTLTHLNSTLVNAGVSVDAAGDFDFWQFAAASNPDGVSAIGEQEIAIVSLHLQDVASISECVAEQPPFCTLSQQDSAAVFGNPGTWVSSTVVPIPAAAYLFGSALFGLGWLRRKSV